MGVFDRMIVEYANPLQYWIDVWNFSPALRRLVMTVGVIAVVGIVLALCIAGVSVVAQLVVRFSGPNLKRLATNRDTEGLVRALQYLDLRSDAAVSLRTIGAPAVLPLIQAIEDPESFISKRTTRRFVKEHKGQYWVGWELIRPAADTLAKINDPNAVEPFIRAISDTILRNEARLAAAKALGNIRDRRAVEPLIEAMGICEDDYNVWSPSYVGHGIEEKVLLCESVATALGKISDPRAVGALIKFLDFGHGYWRISEGKRKADASAVKALGEIGDPRAIETLLSRLQHWVFPPGGDEPTAHHHADISVCQAAATALAKIGEPAVPGLLQRLVFGRVGAFECNERFLAFNALCEIGLPAVAALTAACNDTDMTIATTAKSAIEEFRRGGLGWAVQVPPTWLR